MHPAVHDDRLVPEQPRQLSVSEKHLGRISGVRDHGIKPCLSSLFLSTETPTRWVAVLDLMRLIEPEAVEPNEPTVRLRLKVPALRSIHRRRRAEQELKKAVASELLADLETNTDAIAA